MAVVPHSLDLALTVCFYMFASAGMSIFNKLVLVHISLPLTIVTIQMAFTVASLLLKPSQLRYGSMADVRRWAFTVPPLFVGMLASSMLAMNYASLGTIVVFRNVAPIPTMLIETMFHIPFVISWETIASLAVIIAGVTLYEAHELSFSIKGILAILVNMAFAVVERIMQRHLMANNPVDLAKPVMMILNNGVGMLPCFLLAIAWGEHAQWGAAFGGAGTRGWIYLVVSCLNGLAISYAGLRLQAMVSATTFMVITNVNKFAVIFFGIITMGDSHSVPSIIGCFLAICGGVLYGEARKRAEKPVLTHSDKDEPGEGASLLTSEEQDKPLRRLSSSGARIMGDEEDNDIGTTSTLR